MLSSSADNILFDLHNSSHPTQPHSIIAKYLQPHQQLHEKGYAMLSPKAISYSQEPRKASRYCMISNEPGPAQVDHTHRTPCWRGWPWGFDALNSSSHSWIFTSVSLGSSPRSYFFTSATGRIGVHSAPKYGTKPIRNMTLHFQDRRKAASHRHDRSCVWTEAISGMIFAAAQKLSGIAWT